MYSLACQQRGKRGSAGVARPDAIGSDDRSRPIPSTPLRGHPNPASLQQHGDDVRLCSKVSLDCVIARRSAYDYPENQNVCSPRIRTSALDLGSKLVATGNHLETKKEAQKDFASQALS